MWLIGSSTALVDSSPDGALAADMIACNNYADAVTSAAKIGVPVTFVLGAEDKMTPIKKSGDLVNAVTLNQVVTFDSIGHMMPVEAPIEAREAISAAIAWAEAAQS